MSSSLTLCTTSLILIPLLLSLEYSWGVDTRPNNLPDDGRVLKGVMVDLDNLELNKGYAFVTGRYGIAIRTVGLPLPGHHISAIVFNNSEVYKCSGIKGDVINSFDLCITKDEMLITIRVKGEELSFGRVGDQFFPLTMRDCYYKIKRMALPYSLDVKQRQSNSNVDVVGEAVYGMMSYDITSRYGTRIDKLVHDNITIWEDRDGSEFIGSAKIIHGLGVRVVSLLVENSQGFRTLCFIGDEGGYYSISAEEFAQYTKGGYSTVTELLEKRKERAA
ncbi:hypothetical protein BgAZ_202040 [Babesia gibsoni]|uniref:Uncharacterized protein n=1 Tax=Babesia gibsoni TaxID=33632 RepID=A0AAD8PDE3_BABGI|nr:hypothetical protein BgAZ_202040 [Babesia gibsoni]